MSSSYAGAIVDEENMAFSSHNWDQLPLVSTTGVHVSREHIVADSTSTKSPYQFICCCVPVKIAAALVLIWSVLTLVYQYSYGWESQEIHWLTHVLDLNRFYHDNKDIQVAVFVYQAFCLLLFLCSFIRNNETLLVPFLIFQGILVVVWCVLGLVCLLLGLCAGDLGFLYEGCVDFINVFIHIIDQDRYMPKHRKNSAAVGGIMFFLAYFIAIGNALFYEIVKYCYRHMNSLRNRVTRSHVFIQQI